MTAFSPIPWSFSDIVDALSLKAESDIYPAPRHGEAFDLLFSGISTDSRTIKKHELFIALKGENFNGHTFIKELADRGIKGFVTDREFIPHTVEKDEIIVSAYNENAKTSEYSEAFSGGNEVRRIKTVFFKVDDTLEALAKLAAFQRVRSKVKLVAITGSNGKTSTKQMMEEIFKTRFNTLATTGNFNNEIGVPLTLLQLSREHQWAIVEMGMNHKGELAVLSRMAMPDIAVVTNTSEAHLEGLGTVYDVAEAKAEIFTYLRKGGTAVINIDDKRWEIIEQRAEENSNIDEIITAGTSKNAVVRAESIKLDRHQIHFTLVVNNKIVKGKRYRGQVNLSILQNKDQNRDTKIDISINTPAFFMALNALLAAGVALKAGLSLYEIKKGLESFTPVPGRMNIVASSNGFNIINDTYNANPASMRRAFETLKKLAGEKSSFAVLGDMLELGEQSEQLHFEIGRKAVLSGVSRLYLYGHMVEFTARGAMDAGLDVRRIIKGDKNKIVKHLLDTVNQGEWILVKGSRGMKMEDVVTGLK